MTAEYVDANTPHSACPDLGSATTWFADDTLGAATVTYCTDYREQRGNWEVELVGADGILRTSHQVYDVGHWTAGPPGERSAGRSVAPPAPFSTGRPDVRQVADVGRRW